MQLLTYIWSDNSSIESFISMNEIGSCANILVQVFSGNVDEQINAHICSVIKTLLPHSHIIGTTTAGEIIHGKMIESEIVVAFALFEHTTIRSNAYTETDAYTCASQIVADLVSDDTKAIILFSDGLKSNGEELLKQITKIRSDIVIAGGRAGDYHAFSKTLVFNDKKIMEFGVVAASLSGKELKINNHYMLNWDAIGELMTITRADKNQLFEINGIPAREVYEKYLGNDIASSLPESGIEFPLITRRGDIDVARAPIAVFDDGSLYFGGNLVEGEQVRFGFGNLDMVREKSFENYTFFKTLPIEATFIYSCSARKALLGKDLEDEFGLLESLAPTAGFFTYGEYFHSAQLNELLNITTTFLSLSEKASIGNIKELQNADKSGHNRALKALSHLVSVTSKELQSLNRHLLEKIIENEKIQASLNEGQRIAKFGIWEWDMLKNTLWWSDGIYLLFGLESQEFEATYEGFLNYVHPDDRELVIMAVTMAVETKQPYFVRHRILRAYGDEECIVEEQGEIVYDENDKPVFMKGTIKDVTELIRTQRELEAYKHSLELQVEAEIAKRHEKEVLLMQQSRLAAMGEMVGNIAHQWRQPLNTLSLVIGNLEDTYEMGMLTDESIHNAANKAYSLIDKMSATIDDFRNFFSADKQISTFNAKEIVSDSIALVEAAMKSYEIEIIDNTMVEHTICGYKNELSQVILNLINNAKDALLERKPKHAKIVIESRDDESSVCLIVSDNGGGVPDTVIERIFEPYFTTKEQGKGTGIGLYMSKTIVEEHMNGFLTVHNNEDGAVFTITLPKDTNNEK